MLGRAGDRRPAYVGGGFAVYGCSRNAVGTETDQRPDDAIHLIKAVRVGRCTRVTRRRRWSHGAKVRDISLYKGTDASGSYVPGASAGWDATACSSTFVGGRERLIDAAVITRAPGTNASA